MTWCIQANTQQGDSLDGAQRFNRASHVCRNKKPYEFLLCTEEPGRRGSLLLSELGLQGEPEKIHTQPPV